jgi:DhnA family fructose-bisphosphate aldolase class Ia
MTSLIPRLNRLLAGDGKCLVVALDHGTTGERRLYHGAEDLSGAMDIVTQACPDAILLSVGQAHLLQEALGRQKPSLVLRADVTNIYGEPGAGNTFCALIDSCVEQAIRLDAACVIANLFDADDQSNVRQRCVENIGRLRSECDRHGMPLMVEARVMAREGSPGIYAPSGLTERLAPIVRQAVELGADLVKADPTHKPDEFAWIVEAASGKPVLVLGGGRVSDEEIVRRTHVLLQQGTRGLVYGRNVFAHPRPAAVVRALMAMLHEGAGVEDALSWVRGAT